jgi:hypothetical protein
MIASDGSRHPQLPITSGSGSRLIAQADRLRETAGCPAPGSAAGLDAGRGVWLGSGTRWANSGRGLSFAGSVTTR